MFFVKKFLSVVLTIIIALSACSVAAYGIDDGVEITEYPVIMVAGYSSTNLFVEAEDGSLGDKLWGLGVEDFLPFLLGNIAKIGIGLGKAVFNKPEQLARVVGEGLIDILGDMACNDDGTPVNKTRVMFPTAEESNCAVMFEEYGNYKDYQFETDIMGLARTYVGAEKIYNFNVDWRMGAEYCADRLDEYIQQVKAFSDCDKVNILAVSHGGQVTGAYLVKYGYKQDVNNAVMTVPALKGAGVLYDLFSRNIKFDELNLIYFIENGLVLEDDFHWLVEAQQLGFLDEVFNLLVPYIFEVGGNWGSVWDFCPSDIYEEMKAKWLDEAANAELIAKSDRMHYEIMPEFSTAFKKCNDEYGMNVSIVAGTDINMTTGCAVNGDGIIYTASSTGATVAPHGERFADGYAQVNDCGGKYKVSPAMTVDASTAYLPDNTWFVEGLFHGMTFWDDYTKELMMLLTLTNEIDDVYSNPAYPQFHESSNADYAVWGCFDKSVEGYLSADDSKIIIKNLSKKKIPLILLGVTADGIDLEFDVNIKNKFIKAGESVEIPFKGEIPAVSAKRISITFTYAAVGSLTPLGQRTMSFTVMNGEKAEYDGSKSCSAYAETPFDKSKLSFMKKWLVDNGSYNFVSMIYTIIYEWFNSVKRLLAF